MPTQRHPHEILIEELSAEYKAILDGSSQAIYIYLDNEHKTCNTKFATTFGYKSVREYETIEDPLVNVDESSVNTVVSAYQNAMGKKIGSVTQVRLKKNDGKTFSAEMMMVPISFKGEMMALHFITPK